MPLPTDVDIRPYRAADEESWLRCRVLSFLHTQYYDDVKNQRPMFDSEALCSVAVVRGATGDTVVGILDIEIDGAAATIDTVAVHPDRERAGIATALLCAALPVLATSGITSLDAWTREDEAANRWYLSHGFRENFRYLHVHQEDADGPGTGFRSPPGVGQPIRSFAHATLDQEAALRARFHRVYQCRQYLMSLPRGASPK